MPGFIITGSESKGPSSKMEAARSHRWEVTFDTPLPVEWSDDLLFYARSISRPICEFDRITMHQRQTEIYLPGKNRPAGQVNLQLYEPVRNEGSNGAASVVRDWWSQWMMNAKKHSLNMPSGSIQGVKRSIRTTLLDGCNTPIWTYIMSGAFPTRVEGSELDYTNSELSTVNVTLSIDAYQEGKDL